MNLFIRTIYSVAQKLMNYVINKNPHLAVPIKVELDNFIKNRFTPSEIGYMEDQWQAASPKTEEDLLR